MNRINIQRRNNWQLAVEQLGFGFHTTGAPYWDESACYTFSLEEIELIELATASLWDICLEAVEHVIKYQLYEKFHIPKACVSYLEKTWREDQPSLFGRFDLCYKNGQVKLIEFNADTPTSIYEAGIVQWFWLQDFDKAKDQFNSIHEKLIRTWKDISPYLNDGPLYFSCMKETLEDLTNVEYLRDCAIQAGIETKFVFVDDIGWDDRSNTFVDMETKPVRNFFKLYPWEWMVREEFGKCLLEPNRNPICIEPAWKMILSNKAILPILWELFPGHPNLLAAYFDKGKLGNYVKKPILSREGANIEIFANNDLLYRTEGEYGEEGYIYQELFELPCFHGNYPLIGSWIIGIEPAGIGIRESDTLVTGNLSRFVPHMMV